MRGVWLCAALLAAAWAQAPVAWTPEFSLQFKTVGNVIPSPDGSRVAWTQTESVMDPEHSEMLTHIFLSNADGSHRMQLTRGDKSCSAPSFSADGKFVYFQSPRSGKMNVYRIAVAGGEAEMLTDFKGNLGNYKLSPDSKTVAFTGYEAPPDEEKNKKEKRDWRVVDANPANMALYLIPAEASQDGKRVQRKLTDGKRHVDSFVWSPDSRAIAFAHQPTPGADDWTRSDLSEVDVASGTVKPIAATNAAEHDPIYSPDGKYLAFAKSSEPPRWATEDRIVLVNRAGGDSRTLPASYDEQPQLLGFTGDSSRLIFVEARHTRAAIYAMPVDGPPQTIFESAKGTINSAGARLNASGTYLGMPMESTEEAPEAYVMKLAGGSPVRLSRANTDLPKLPLGKTEPIKWKSKDGLEVEGLLTYPSDYQPGKRYPLILNIHGGPTGVFSETFTGRSGLYPIAVFAARGYAVLRPNPRGSSGYGRTFRFANYNDWGGKDFEDDQAGVDHVISMGVADPERLAVMGWSYGGFMTSWTITQTHRFKAAVIGAGVTDLWSFTGTADIPGFLPDYFGGEPWTQFESFQKHSPITYVKNVTTPTLVLHGEADVRVPTSQGYEYYHALKRQGVTAKMVVYPRQPHGPQEPKFILDIMQRHLDWVDKYVR
ncbi:MAG TPA: S9 family peptidase [Bryobacteraceae bacterium]|nr:S9 family peptidase [Bryobacteraceae bacterium]